MYMYEGQAMMRLESYLHMWGHLQTRHMNHAMFIQSRYGVKDELKYGMHRAAKKLVGKRV